jgi:hypothetical protein
VSTAYENDLWALTVEKVANLSKQDVETKVLQRVDNDAYRVLEKMKSGGLAGLSTDDRQTWALFLNSLRWRQPRNVLSLREKGLNALREELNRDSSDYDSLAGKDDPPTLADWAEKRFPGLTANYGLTIFGSILGDSTIASKLTSLTWWLCDVTAGSRELLLADHPCILTTGIDDQNFMFALPIGPYRAFLATRGERTKAGIMRTHPALLAQRLNESALNQVETRLYARTRSPERFIRNRFAGIQVARSNRTDRL